MALCVAIVAAIEDCRHVASEQMCSGMKNGRKYRIKCFNDRGVWDEPGYFFCGRSVQADLKASGPKRIHATDEGFAVHRAGGGECILDFSPWDSEKEHICKTRRIPGCARSSMRSDLQHKMFQLLRCSRVAEHHVMPVLCPKTAQACPHFPRTNDSDIHIPIVSKMPGGAVQLCTVA